MNTWQLVGTLNEIGKNKITIGLGLQQRYTNCLKEILCMLDVKRRFGQHSQVSTNANERIRAAKRQLKMMKRLRGGL